MTAESLVAGSLETLAGLIAAGAVTVPLDAVALSSAGVVMPARVARLVQHLHLAEASAAVMAAALRALAEDAAAEARAAPICVASGPRAIGSVRDTASVMDMLFRVARRHLLVVGYALHDGGHVLGALAGRMDAEPELEVVFCLDVARPHGDTSVDQAILARWAARFRSEQWPGRRLPAVFYDPRALSAGGSERASLHAKCIVADCSIALVTSANLTRAAQERNIEFGLLVEQAACAQLVAAHFEALMRDGTLRRLPL